MSKLVPITMSKIMSPKQVYEAFRQGLLADTDDWKKLIAEEATIVGPLVELKGKDSFIKIHESFFQSVERQVVHVLIEHDDLVITQISTTIETSKKKTVTLKINEWYTIKQGKIEALVVYFDTAVLNFADKVFFASSTTDSKN